jgi:AcrR family transcriptional regulator
MAIAPKADVEGGPSVAITNVAMHLFGKQGFTGTSMRDIATAVGRTGPAAR